VTGSSKAQEKLAETPLVLEWQQPRYVAARRLPVRGKPNVRQQSAMDCGAACLATVARFHGKRVSLNRVREAARVGTSGASMLNIKRAAEAMGFETIPMLATTEHLRANALPAIVNWKGYHWIVVYSIDDRHVTVADPGQGLLRLSLSEFEEGWTRYTLYLQPTPAFGEVEESNPTLKQFTPYVRPYRRILLEIVGASLAIQVLAIFLPVFTKFIVDDAIIGQHTQWLVAALVAMGAVIGLNWAVSLARQSLLLTVAQRINVRMLADFYRHVLSLPLPFFEQRRTGDIISRFEENTKLTSFFTSTGADVLIDTLTAVMYLVLMVHYNARLTALCAAFLVLHILNLYWVTPRMQHVLRNAFQRGAELQSHTIESLKGLRTIRTLGIEPYIRWTWENLFARYTNEYFKTLKYSVASGLLSQFINASGQVAVLFYGAWMVLQGQLSLGALVAFTAFLQGLIAPATKLVGSWQRLQEAMNSVERLNDVYESAPETTAEPGDDHLVVPRLNGFLRFDSLTFRYEPEGSNVLQNVSLQIHAGARVGFVGRSGSGKSTLLKLLMGFYAPVSGRVLVDGFDLSQVWLPSLRRQIGVIPQESALFRGTIRDNIALASPSVPPSEVEWAARMADAHEFIARLPLGYDTVLEEQGSNLSGGQRQRIGIARAILQRPRMLVLDEATSALDNESERRVIANLRQEFAGCTVLMIAHRLSTVRHADLIVVLDHGNIVEQGSHEELMKRKGLYYFLSTQQLSL
jgi:ATP-binding cassette subfamily B protein